MKRLSSLLLLILAIGSSGAYCQKIYKAEGSAKVRLEDHLSREETMELAREQAVHSAIESLFGSHISKDAYVDVEEGESSIIIKSDSEVKGEWLKTTDESFHEETKKIKNPDGKGQKSEIWIVCDIEGKVREITTPLINLEFLSLDCPSLDCGTTDFENGDSFYMYFKTPENGYLSIYLADSEQAFRLLPYSGMPTEYLHNVPVEADKEYILFYPDRTSDYFKNFPYYYADEISLDTEDEQEFYKLYLIFSPKPFIKPILEDEVEEIGEYTTPKFLSRRNFDVWVQDNRIFDTDFYYKTLNLRVRR
jgi:hypothetical protein